MPKRKTKNLDLQEANEFLTNLLISELSITLGKLDAIENPEELTNKLKTELTNELNTKIKKKIKQLKDNEYAKLEILLRHPYLYEVVIPQK